jgi:hypothetical protein
MKAKALTSLSYAVYIAILIFYLGFAYYMYPETKGHSIEEVSMLFDKKYEDVEALNSVAINQVQKNSIEWLENGTEQNGNKRKGCTHRETVVN